MVTDSLAAFLDLMEIEDLLADAGHDIGYDGRIEIDLAALAEFCRFHRFCLFDDIRAARE